MMHFANRLYRILTARLGFSTSPCILLYHHVSNQGLNNNLHCVSTDHFHRHLEFLSRNYKIVFCDELLERISKGQSVKKLAAITFDDGSSSILKTVVPFLVSNRIPSTIFVSMAITSKNNFWRSKVNYLCENHLEQDFLNFAGDELGLIRANRFYADSKTAGIVNSSTLDKILVSFFQQLKLPIENYDKSIFASVEELNALDKTWIQLGNHSLNHYVLASLPKKQQFQEISANKQFLETTFKHHQLSKIFSMPFGNHGTFNRDTVACLATVGYAGFLTSDRSRIRLARHTIQNKNLIELPRIMPREGWIF